jgi:hypothetical protein
MKRNPKLVALVLLVALVALTLTSVPAPAMDCDSLPWGWWYHPGLYLMCLLYNAFEQCGALDWDCWEEYWQWG